MEKDVILQNSFALPGAAQMVVWAQTAFSSIIIGRDIDKWRGDIGRWIRALCVMWLKAHLFSKMIGVGVLFVNSPSHHHHYSPNYHHYIWVNILIPSSTTQAFLGGLRRWRWMVMMERDDRRQATWAWVLNRFVLLCFSLLNNNVSGV